VDATFRQDLLDAITAAAVKSAALVGRSASVFAPVSGPASKPSDSEYESESSFSEDECSDSKEEDDSCSRPQPKQPVRGVSILGNDLSNGQPARLSKVRSWTDPQVQVSRPEVVWTGPTLGGPGLNTKWTGPWVRSRVGPGPDPYFKWNFQKAQIELKQT